jgi:2-keto-3-deoxy-L-arabinonate dehydratase
MDNPLRGVLPIAPTPFTEAGEVDFDGQRRVLDCMIDQGVDGICLLANFSEQFLLTDDERDRLTELGLTHVGGRVPVIVTCSHFSTRVAAERGRRAAALGASMIMLMPPYHGVSLRADEEGTLAHFAAVAEAARIPLMVQDAPLSGVQLPVSFLVRLATRVPLVNAVKIEVPGAAAKLRALIAARSTARSRSP